MEASKREPVYSQAYIDTGRGPTVILLHGLFGKATMWKNTVDALKKNFRVIVPRLPIFDLPAEHASIKKLSQHLHEFIEWHELHDVHLVGHGIAGQLALVYTAEHPDNVNKVVMSGSALFKNDDLEDIIADEAHEYEVVGERVRSAFYNQELASRALVTDIHKTIGEQSVRTSIESLIRTSAEDSIESMLNRIDHRVMLLWGLEDKITPPGVTFHYHDFLQNSEIRFIEKCGHLPMVEEPEKFVKQLVSFFG